MEESAPAVSNIAWSKPCAVCISSKGGGHPPVASCARCAQPEEAFPAPTRKVFC